MRSSLIVAALGSAALVGCAIAPAAVRTAPAISSTAAAHQAARLGDTISLTGNAAGEKLAITVVRVIRHGRGADQFTTPERRHRFFAVQFRLTNTGTAPYSDSPDNSATVIDSLGQSYQSDLSAIAECQSFPGTETIAPGSSGLGCVVFQVPAKAAIVRVQFVLDSGFASDTGQWAI